jgi:hypothetical protein
MYDVAFALIVLRRCRDRDRRVGVVVDAAAAAVAP